MGEGRHGKGQADEFAFGIFHQGYVFQIQQAQEGLYVVVNYLRGEDGKIIKLAVGAVHQVENLLSIPLFLHLPFGNLADVQVVSLRDQGGGALHFLGHFRGHENAVFQPVVGLDHAQGLEMLPIIGVVVLEHEGGDIIEALHHTAFAVKVRKAQGTAHLRHPVFLAKGYDGLQKGPGYFFIVDKVYPPEANLGMVPVPVGYLIDDGYAAPGQFSILVGQELAGLAILSHGVFVHIQGGHFVHIEVGDIVRASLIQLQGKFDKGFQIGLRFYCLDAYRHVSV